MGSYMYSLFPSQVHEVAAEVAATYFYYGPETPL